MRIQVSAAGKWTLDTSQQVWHGEDSDTDNVMQRALFAGQQMLAIKENEGVGGFGLRYLGFQATGFLTMESAKQAAPDFARRVLIRMAEMVS
ncbi:hypothetical protein [Thiothrix sp.]|jgi:hypothetical protein|uniref:hypothetical protein n=1 Tax=Thiothrix sp. TaxID=1032 RepID=UPI00257CE514|nr:hypothetical protein [Thiothrix sp.]